MNMNKRALFAISLAIPALMATSAFASDNEHSTEVKTETTTTTAKHCVRDAAKVEQKSFKAAMHDYNAARFTALAAREVAMKNAEALTDPAAQKAAITKANDDFKTANTAARTTLAAARTAAQTAFKTAKDACKK